MSKLNWLSKCKNCEDFVVFRPRERFLNLRPTARDIAAGTWKHVGAGGGHGCTGQEPRDGRTPEQDLEVTRKNPYIASNIRNGARLVKNPRRKI